MENWTNLTDQEKMDLLETYNSREVRRLIPTATLLGLFSLVGTVGNCVSVYVFIARMRRNFQNNLFIYLCINNVLACAVCIPSDIVDIAYTYTYPSPLLCKVTRFFNLFTVGSYVLTLGTLSVYRYRAASLAKLTTDTKRTSARGVVALVVGSVCIAWIGPVVYGMHTTPTDIKGLAGQDCSIADDVVSTGWQAGFYSMLIVGFTTLVMTVVISYYRIWRIVRRSKMTVAAHTTMHMTNPILPSIAVVTQHGLDPDAWGGVTQQGQGGNLARDAVFRDLMPSASALYRNADSNLQPTDYTIAISDIQAPTGGDDDPTSVSTKLTPGRKNDVAQPIKRNLMESRSLCVFDEKQNSDFNDNTNLKHFIGSAFKNKKSVTIPDVNIQHKSSNSLRVLLYKSNPDLCTIEADDNMAALFRTLSVAELRHGVEDKKNNETLVTNSCPIVEIDQPPTAEATSDANNFVQNLETLAEPDIGNRSIHSTVKQPMNSLISDKKDDNVKTSAFNSLQLSHPSEYSDNVHQSKFSSHVELHVSNVVAELDITKMDNADQVITITDYAENDMTITDNADQVVTKTNNIAQVITRMDNADQVITITDYAENDMTITDNADQVVTKTTNIAQVITRMDNADSEPDLNPESNLRENNVARTPVKYNVRTRTTKTALENAITRTAFILTFSFIVSYLPFFMVSIPHFVIPNFDYNQNTATINIINICYRLYFINPTISPFIFLASNLDFRRNVKSLSCHE